MKDYEARRVQGIDVLRTLTKSDNPELLAKALESENGALGSFAIDFVMGDIWSRTQLSRRDRNLVVLAILGALHLTEPFAAYVHGAINHGLSPEEIREAITLMCVYAGFPRALAAMTVANRVLCDLGLTSKNAKLTPAAQLKDAERRRRGAEVVAKIAGSDVPDPEKILVSLAGELGPLGYYATMFAFGEVWSRPELSRRDRSLVVVSILTALGRIDELKIHAATALRHGLTREELEELMLTIFGYAGAPCAVEGMRVVVEATAD